MRTLNVGPQWHSWKRRQVLFFLESGERGGGDVESSFTVLENFCFFFIKSFFSLSNKRSDSSVTWNIYNTCFNMNLHETVMEE